MNDCFLFDKGAMWKNAHDRYGERIPQKGKSVLVHLYVGERYEIKE